MFKPEKMSFVNISVLDQNLPKVLDSITKLGIMHIVDKSELPSTSGMLGGVNIQPVQDKLAEFNDRIDVLSKAISTETLFLPEFGGGMPEDIEIDPFRIANKIESELIQMESDAESLLKRIEQLQIEIDKLNNDSEKFYMLEAKGLDLDHLKGMRFLYFTFGDVPLEFNHYNRLVESLSRIPCLLMAGEITGIR